ncbi:MAG: NAD(P)-binding protein [Euryarchaeota archaeon]|nr:NAD(P)-binding protein [Euryarchaeota archaeon]
MIVIGAGIGGLLVATLLQKKHDLTIFERGAVGGRFRNLPYKGFQLSTGAFHALPHGSTGPAAEILKKTHTPHKIVDAKRWGTFLVNGEEHTFNDLNSFLSFMKRLRVSKVLFDMRFRGGDKTPLGEYIDDKFGNEIVNKAVKAFCGFSMSVDPDDITTETFFPIVESLYRYGGSGVIVGGCSGITDRVAEGKNIIKKRIKEIVIEENRVKGVVDSEDNFYEDSTVISDIGVKKTIEIVGKKNFPKEYLKAAGKLQEANGIKINIASKESILDHKGVLLTCDTERVEGLNQVTNVDPSLAPEGYHLIMTHQTLRSNNVKKEIDRGLVDIEKIFGDKKYEILLVQTFRNGFPVNRAVNGQDFDCRTPIKGLYLVGDSVKKETMEVDGIAKGILELYEELSSIRE